MGGNRAALGRCCNSPKETEPRQRRSSSSGTKRQLSSQRNGGRHCCQPPLRRAKDLPVFATWSTLTFRPSLTRSRSWLTSSGVAFHQTAPSEEEPDLYLTAPPEGSLVFRR